MRDLLTHLFILSLVFIFLSTTELNDNKKILMTCPNHSAKRSIFRRVTQFIGKSSEFIKTKNSIGVTPQLSETIYSTKQSR